MSTVLNPYPHHQLQLGILETGLKSLKTARELMSDQEFSGMYWAIERHHRDLKLAHLTGKAKDVMEQAEKDTKFYNILTKMLCEVKKLPMKKQRDSLKKVHTWYLGNRHTLQTGPKFGKTSQKLEAEDMLKNAKNASKFRKSSAKESEFSNQSSAVKSRNQSGKNKIKNGHKGGSDFRQFINDNRDEQDDVSTPNGHRDSVFPLSDLTSNFTGNDFLTSRFLSELPTSKLSWNLDSPVGKTPTDWEGTDIELQRIQESALSAPAFSDHFRHSRLSAPNSSPRSHDGSHDNDSVVSHGSDGNVSSGVDAGSIDMMDFSSDVRRRLTRGQTPSASLRAAGVSGMTPDGSSTEVYGLQKRMVHSIASLVNPHAKMAESEAKRAEQEYYRAQTSATPRRPVSSVGKSGASNHLSSSEYSGQTPILRTVSVSGNRMDALQNFHTFSNDHLYGQDILSKLNFVGRSGTALDVRYCAHDLGDMPENHTKELINLYGINNDDAAINTDVIQNEGNIHDQPLEDFYQTADTIYPTHLPKYRGSSAVRNRTKSAPAQRRKSAKPFKSSTATDRTGKQEKITSKGHRTPAGDADKENEEGSKVRPKSAIRLDTVVNMIDSVKDEMNFFKEKLAPTPMSGFRQPAHVGVPSKPHSRPATARSGKSIPRGRSPSPQQRPPTPTDQDNLMMNESEGMMDTSQPNAFPARPHSASVNRAVDWRGRVTPGTGKYKSRMRFGGHTYVQQMKPSLRTAGAVTGKRPKTAPVNISEKWKSEKDDRATILPQLSVQNYPNIGDKTPYPYYPVKKQEPPAIIVTESDKNMRVPQAASNNVTEVDQKDVDAMLNISYLTGHSDSRFGSMGSLYFDEEFFKSVSSRYTPASAMSLTQDSPRAKEYLSLIGPMPMTPGGSRAQSRQGQKKVDAGIDQIPEESTVREESLQVEVGGELVNQSKDTVEETGEPDQDINTSGEKDTNNTQEYPNLSKVEIEEETEDDRVEPDHTATQEDVKFAREPIIIQTADQDGDEVHIEVTAIPASGRPLTPPQGHEAEIERLSKSEQWQFQPDLFNSDVHFEGGSVVKVEEEDFLHPETHYRDQWSKNIVRPENYCFQCLPDSMATKVGRSAGRTPGGITSPAGQVLRMSRKQNEYFKKAPPVRTPPSIPSPHHPLGGRSPRQGQQYISELEHHARKAKSPRHYMEQGTIMRGSPGGKADPRRSVGTSSTSVGPFPVVELRKDVRSAPPGSRNENTDELSGALNVISLRTPGRAKTAPSIYSVRQSSDNLVILQPFPEETEDEMKEDPNTAASSRRVGTRQQPQSTAPNTASQSIAHIGRPIAQVSNVHDPEEVEEAVVKQKEAKAAVDIQRIFRGYVCRNSYNKLLWENRKKAEDKQMAMIETQRELRKHQGRKARIYNRPPLDPALLQWAKDFKEIQMQHHGKRQYKMDNLSKEMLANQQKQKSKIELIGPHVEIYDIYHPKEIGPTKREMHVAAVLIQKQIRGFLVRRRFDKLRRKAVFCGSNWKKIVGEYKSQLLRVQRWHGVERPKAPFSVSEMGEYMDMRRRYESQFDKKAFAEELELSEIVNFFRECDLYPSNAEIDEGIDVIFQGRSLKGHGLKKQEAMNLLFYIYVPQATGLKNTRQSTWMNPIIDGVEAKKLLGSEFVEPVPLNVCANLVINSKRERREKEEALKQRQLEEEERNNEDAIDNVETANHLNKQTSEKVNPSADPSKTTQKAKRTTFNAAGRGNISNRGSKSKN